MKIAVLSGKGGTGKTTIAASLAQVIDHSQYIDCDVEEPNGFLFLKPYIARSEEVTVLVPNVDRHLCDLCGACARICQFNAIAVTKKRVLIFPELCHHCGACALACKPYAITEVERSIGVVESDENQTCIQGRLNLGEPAGLPIIAALKNKVMKNRAAILDCSPGASCTVVRSIEGCDYALLVTEPTPFGLHDLKIAVELIRKMAIPAGVVLNKAGKFDAIIEEYCIEENLKILLKIPFSRTLAEYYSRAQLPVEISSDWLIRFQDLSQKIIEEVHQ